MIDDITSMAEEAGGYRNPKYPDVWIMDHDDLKRFAELFRADEREACAQVVNDDRSLSDDDCIRVMRAIRARGNK